MLKRNVCLEYISYWSLISNILTSSSTAAAKFKGSFMTYKSACFMSMV